MRRWPRRSAAPARWREYPYQEAHLLQHARRFRRELTLPLILLGGITRRETMDAAIAEGSDFVAMARALLREPNLPNRLKSTPDTPSPFTHCNKCMSTIYRRTHRVLT